ncbi:snare-like protein [Annulohypoxylon truncatum]|uniref:snare-like protein n=1 Tax=Annulohypoxylon truncatum TaxID=327061 RepID=UPI002008BE51|nr:snare-like protein [Annulohypoxylon truncatum]KAI1207367.1 snare-like protein [Annulohypoxylon truncatum]
MATAIPSIACLGVIGRNNNPLHITIFPSYDVATNKRAPLRTPLQFSLLLSSTLDVFEARRRASSSTSQSGGSGGGGAGAAAPVVTGDFGLLHAVDERLAAYGFETNTGVKFVAVVDMRGRFAATGPGGTGFGAGGVGVGGGGGGLGGTGDRAMSLGVGAGVRGGVGLREQELRVVFRAMQTAYVRLLQNPFYDPDEHAPLMPAGGSGGGSGGKRITSRKFAEEMRRIGEGWAPGVTSL